MNLKIAIETFQEGDLDNPDIILSGLAGIEKANYELSEAYYYKHISDENKISNVIGLGPNHKFFYKISSYKDNVVVAYEKGIGYAYQHNGQTYFKRLIPLVYGKNESHAQIISDNKLRFYFQEGATNVIISEIPPNLALLYHSENSLVVANDSFFPINLELPNNSFLATVNEEICSLSFDSKEFSEYVSQALCNYTKQLSLRTSKLNANKLSTKQLQLEPSSGTNAKKGTFIYDDETDTVKFYNGEKWRTLQWVDEEKSE
jgi:hypothetical protein